MITFNGTGPRENRQWARSRPLPEQADMTDARTTQTVVDDPCVCPRCRERRGKFTHVIDQQPLDKYVCESCGQVWVVKRTMIIPEKVS